MRWGLYWLPFMAAGALGAALVAGHLPWAAFGSLVVLLLALSYVHMGSQPNLPGTLSARTLVWQAILGARERDVTH